MPVRLFVGNLPYDATEDEIRQHFSSAGNVLNVFVPVDRETGRKRGFAFVEFNDAATAQEAIRLFNSQPFKGRPLAVNEARAKESRPPVGGGAPYRPGPPRPMSTGPRPMSPGGGPPSRGFGRPDEASLDVPSRGDKPNRKQFGPDAKPFRSRNQRTFRPESGKKALKEKFSGQLHSVDDDEDMSVEPEIDNFATGVEDEHSEENH
jgi:RNA recognition motif-containing protein